MTAGTERSKSLATGVPASVIKGAGVLLMFSLALTLLGRSQNIGAVHMPETQPYKVLHLRFEDESDGRVVVRNAADGNQLYVVAPGTNGFLRGALRGFAQERLRDGVDVSPPFTLTRWTDGTLSLQDEETGRRIDLDAFGPTQAQAFARLFAAKETTE